MLLSGNEASQLRSSGSTKKSPNAFTPTPKKKKFKININNMGVNIDRNEYYEIKLSNSAFPERGL